MDLVEVAPRATPPVCRVLNYGKFQYEESRKQREAKRKQHQHRLKEIKFHPNIDKHDYETKLNRAIAFLGKGYKVKISMYFRGREMAHTDLGRQLLERVIADVEGTGVPEAPLRRAGRGLSAILAPGAHK